MHKLNSMISTWLLTATAIVGLPYLLTQGATGKTIPEQQLSSWQVSQSDPNQTPTSPMDKVPGTKRGIFCAIAPREIDPNTVVWSDRPLFYWRGILGKIEVRSHDREEVLWSQPVTAVDRGVPYSGKPLQPGQTYDWVSFNLQNNAIARVPFKVMDAQERDRINTQLQSVEGELKAKGATADEIVLRRAQYFAQEQLWSDVWREVFSVEKPSAELTKFIQRIPVQICNSPSGQNSLPSP